MPPTVWHPWTAHDVADRLSGLDAPWCVAGGWALDIWAGRRTRRHEDIEIAILRADWPHVVARLAGCRLLSAVEGELEMLRPGDPVPARCNQVWLADPALDCWRVEVLLEPGDRATWVYRRHPSVTRPRRTMIEVCAGVPVLRPEGVLLYKAKQLREKDEHDFSTFSPMLSREAQAWLRAALDAAHPGHPWHPRLDARDQDGTD